MTMERTRTRSGVATRQREQLRMSPEAMPTVVIFGVTGDLAARKLIPALFNLWRDDYIPKKLLVVGVARRPYSNDEIRQELCEGLKEHSRSGHGESDTCSPFVGNIVYHQLQFDDADGYDGLREHLETLEKEHGASGNRLYYLSSGPEFFSDIVHNLGEHGLITPPGESPYTRVVVEKPFGHDLESARALNDDLRSVLAEEQIFRIDHYLGKETVQNILAFRFGNAIFEPIFNHKYVDHVQITVAETGGMEGRRGPFYDQYGALRDVVQNHGLQLLCLAAMEPPAVFGADYLRNEKLKVLQSAVLPVERPTKEWAVRGQYGEGKGQPGYVSEKGVAEDSVTETYAAIKAHIDNWRWAGTPFFIRTGKRLKKRLTEIAVRFKKPPTHYFREMGVEEPKANVLVFRIQPDEGISLTIGTKPPGMGFGVDQVKMDFTYGGAFEADLPEAYERLLLDAMRGESTLFMRADEIEQAWSLITQVLDAWKDAPEPSLYRPGSWGPPEANALFEACEGCWRNDDD